MDFFGSDYHLDHKNIIKYCDRPYGSVNEMNEEIIRNNNSIVGVNDNLYIPGDMFFCNATKAVNFLKRMNGKKHLILGNHDSVIRKNRALFEEHFEFIGDYLEIRIDDPSATQGRQLICLSHYAFKVWNGSHRSSWQLYGHSHGSLPDDPNALQMDVGVDCNNYFPFSYSEIKSRMSKKTYKPMDHHGK